MLCAFKTLYHRPHFTVGGSWNKSLHLQPLQRCYCEISGSPASACVMRSHCFITYTQFFHAIIGLLAVGEVGNLLCAPLRIIYKQNCIKIHILVFLKMYKSLYTVLLFQIMNYTEFSIKNVTAEYILKLKPVQE